MSALAYSAHLSRRFSQVQKFSTVLHSGILLDVDKSEYSLHEWFKFHEIAGKFMMAEEHRGQVYWAGYYKCEK